MGSFLHKLGATAFNHPWRFVGTWVLVLAIAIGGAVWFSGPTSNSITIPGTEAQQALDQFSQHFPDAGKGSARIVFASDQGVDKSRKTIETVVNDIAKVEGVSGTVSPFTNADAISDDGKIAYAQVQLEQEGEMVTQATRDGVAGIINQHVSDDLQIEQGGDVISMTPGEILGIGEIAGVVFALIVLVVTLGALVAAGLPIIVALVSVAAGAGGLFTLSQVVDINTTTPVLAVMLGLAVGIDYSLFIVSKYRKYLGDGHSHADAAAKAIATAGNAVLFAAATVVIALSALAVVQIPFLTTMGLAGAATVAIAGVVAVTLLPALLGLFGKKVFGKKAQNTIEKAQRKGPHDSHKVAHKTIWYKWGNAIVKHPAVSLVAAVIVLAVIAFPVKDLTLGLPTDQFASPETTQRKAYDLLSEGFGEGFNGPLLLVVDNLPKTSDKDAQEIRQTVEGELTAKMNKAAKEQQEVFEQRAATIATPEEYIKLQQDIATAQEQGKKKQAEARQQAEQTITLYTERFELNKIAEKIADLDNVEQALPALVSKSGTSGVVQVVAKSAPSDDATRSLIATLRDPEQQKKLTGDEKVTLGVTGTTALETDINKKLADALPVYLGVVVGLSLVLLIIAFRSILVPIKATLGFLLSVLAMFGAVVAVFQLGWFGIADAPGPIISFVPIIATGILFGLAMDYEFFLVSSIHEEYTRTGDPKKAVANGFGLGSKVVTAAGLIMIAVFGGFITNHEVTIQAIGFGLAVGVLVDAFIVRMVIVPAVLTLLGKSAWWLPQWLDKRLPHVSIEGEE